MCLPKTTVPEERWSSPYSLSGRKRELSPLKEEMEAFTMYSTNEQQFNRPGGSVADSTMEGIQTTLYLYLGFLEHYSGVVAPSFEDLLDAEGYVQFMSFMVAKGRTIDSLKAIICHTRKALIWLGKEKPELLVRVTVILEWIDTVKTQLVLTIPKKKKDIGALEGGNEWIVASDLVVRVHKFEVEVMREVKNVGKGKPLGHALSRTLHNCLLASFMFSHLPPVRLVCLRTLQIAGVVGCPKVDCRTPGCVGNRLYHNGGDLHMLLSHYKVDKA